ncbi:Snf7-domain-containing protein, partial [Terfezia claveryi]
PASSAILDMKLQRDKIKQYRKRIQAVLNREHEIAIECLHRGDKSRAKLALRRRKYQEQLLEKADNQLETLEELVSTVEFSLMQKDVLYGLQQGNEALKEIHKEMSLEAVEKLMDETAEGIAYQKEIDALLGSRLTNDDEDEVEDELAVLEAEQLPVAPTEEPATNVETLEEAKARRTKERIIARRKAL